MQRFEKQENNAVEQSAEGSSSEQPDKDFQQFEPLPEQAGLIAPPDTGKLRVAEQGRVWAYLGMLLAPHRRRLLAVTVTTIGVTLLTLAGPVLLGEAIDRGVRQQNLAALNVIGFLFLIVTIALPFLSRIQTLLMARVGEDFLAVLRGRVFESLVSLPLGTLERESSGALVSRLTSDVEALTVMVRLALPALVRATLLLSLALFVLLFLSPLFTLVSLVGVLPAFAAAIWYKYHTPKLYAAERERTGEMMGVLQEGLLGLHEVQAFGREEDHRRQLSEHNGHLVGAYLATTAARNRLRPTITLSRVLATAAVLAGGTYLVSVGAVTLGTVATFVLYIALFFDPIESLIDQLDILQAGTAALARLVGVMDAADDATGDATGTMPQHGLDSTTSLPQRGTLEAKNVTFGYDPENPVLSGVSLRIEPGETLALVGPTGAGKTTLARLLARLHDPDGGEVRVGGVDLREADPDSLRGHIVVAAQEGHLFSGTIADNVRFARPGAGDAEVEEALRRIGAYERFAQLPEGLQTDVQARGARLSSGERQLISLARIALADPAVAILDEATSSLDPATEAAVEEALHAVRSGRTLVLIAHRLTTAARADRIAVIDEGRLVETGPHEELLRQNGSYAAMWASWQGGEGQAV